MRIATISIFINNENSVKKVNEIIHEYRNLCIGRFGLPNIEDNLNIITLVVKGPQDEISAMSGKLGNIDGVKSQTTYSKN